MKKSKFILLSLALIVLLGFSLIFVPVGVKAASDNELGINYWEFWITRYYVLNIAYNELQYELETAFDNGFTEGFVDGYYVGYNEGVQTGAPEAYEQGFIDGQESKLAQNNEAFYQGIEKWLVPAIITVILVGGFVTIAVRKRREE